MSHIGRQLLFTAFCTVGLAADILSSIRLPEVAGSLGHINELTTINRDVTCWLSGLGTHNIYGNLDNYGNLIISQTDWTQSIPGGQTSDWTGSADGLNGILNNYGSILLNDVSAASAPTHDWIVQSIKNEGTIQWCGRGDTGGSTYHMSTSGDLINNGLIVFEQVRGNYGTAMTFQTTTLQTSAYPSKSNVYNNGGFLLRSARVDIMQNIYGTGCWIIDSNAVLYLQDGLSAFNNYGYKPSLEGQSISFVAGVTATLHMDTAVYSRNSQFGARLYNYGGAGHSIEFYETISRVSYDEGRGVLSVYLVGRNHVDITIGGGYDASKFSVKRRQSNYAFFNAVYYGGSVPQQTAPAQCGLTAPACGPIVYSIPPKTSSAPASSSGVAASSSFKTVTASSSNTQSASSSSKAASSSSAVGSSASSAPSTLKVASSTAQTSSAPASSSTRAASSSAPANSAQASSSTRQASTSSVQSAIASSCASAVTSMVTSYVNLPASTITSYGEGVTVTSYVTLPASTITSDGEGVTVTSYVTLPASTITSDSEGVTVTVTATERPSPITVTEKPSPITVTVKSTTVTVTVKPSPITITAKPVTKTVTKAVTKTATHVITACSTSPASYDYGDGDDNGGDYGYY